MKLEQKIIKKMLEKKLKDKKISDEKRQEVLDILKEVVINEKRLEKVQNSIIKLMEEVVELTKKSGDISEKAYEFAEKTSDVKKEIKELNQTIHGLNETIVDKENKEGESNNKLGKLLVTLIGGLITFIGDFFKKTTIKIQPTAEHYNTPQKVIVVDPFTGKAMDWSRALSGKQQRSTGTSIAGGPSGTTSVMSVLINGTIDGVNTVFTLASTPANGILYISIGRQEQVEGTDFTRSGDTITYTTAPDISLSGYPHRAIIY